MGASGKPKTKGSGRVKGIPNKNTLPLEEKAKELGIDPFEVLLLFAKSDWKSLGYEAQSYTKTGRNGETYEVDYISSDLRLKAASEACQYLFPKRKALDHTLSNPEGESSGFRMIVEDYTTKKAGK